MIALDKTEISKANGYGKLLTVIDRWGAFVIERTSPTSDFGLASTGPVGASAPIGFNSHLMFPSNSYTTAQVISSTTALNGRMVRDELKWSSVELTRGALAFPGVSAQLQKISDLCANGPASGVDPFLLLDYGNVNYGYDSPVGYKGGLVLDADELAGYAAFCAFSAALATGCTKFELWNEWQFGAGATAQEVTDLAYAPVQGYVNMVKAAFASIRAVRPDAEVIVGTFGDPYWQATMNSGWLDGFLATDALGYCTGVSLHQYQGFLPPEFWHDQLFSVIQKIRTKTTTHKIYLSEVGWFNGTDANSITEAEAAARYSRFPFLLRCLDISGTTIYDLFNDGTTVAKEENFGFYTRTLVEKAQAGTIRDALAHMNAATTARHYMDSSMRRRVVLMDTSSGQRAACWAMNATGTTSLVVTASAPGTLSIQTMGGSTATQAIVAGPNTVSVTLSDTAKVVFADVPITIAPPV